MSTFPKLDVSNIPTSLEDSLLSPGGSFRILSPRVSEGRLFVQIISCTVPWPTVWKAGVYCIIMVEKQNSRTATVEAHPDSTGKRATVEWGQRFNFDFTQENAEFQITVWGRGNDKQTAALGNTLRVRVADFPPDQSVKQEFVISDKCILTLKFNLTPIIKRKITEKEFERVKIIGRGSFGTVLLVKKKETGCLYAMKVLHKKNIIERNAVRHAISERTVLKNINHPFLVHLKYAFQNPEHLFMVIDYLNGGELFFHLQQEDCFSEERAKFYAAEIVLALGYLHDNGIMYRDLKPENILLDMEGHICIVDFGLCKTGLGVNSKTGTFCGSLEYMAPEVLEGKDYSKDIDWWALATMVYEMIEGIPPFWDEDQDIMLENISRCNILDLLKVNYKFSRECKDFIISTLNIEPTKRLGYGENGTQDIKNHPWFSDIDWIKMYNKQVEPIFKPHLENESDTRYFDEEVTAEDPHGPNFNSNIDKLDLEDDPFDDFSFEEPFNIKTPVKTPSRRTRPNKNRRSTPMKISLKSPPKIQPFLSKFFEQEAEQVPEVVRTKTPKKTNESKPPRKDSNKSPIKDLSSSGKKTFDLTTIETALPQSEKSPRKSDKSPRNFFQSKGTSSITKEEKKPTVAKKLTSKSDQNPIPVISVDQPVTSISLTSSNDLKLPEDSIAKTGRKFSHGIKPVSLAPVIHRHVRTKSASSASPIISTIENPENTEIIITPRKVNTNMNGVIDEEDKQNCLIS